MTAVSTVNPLAARMTEILHLGESRIKRQGTSGNYEGASEPFTLAALEAHLAGEATIAIGVLSRNKDALFIGIDVDEDFDPLVPVFREVFDAIGGRSLCDASFLTDGSSFGRGKAIVAFEQPYAHIRATAIARGIQKRLRHSNVGSALSPNALTVYPQERTGGILRILGRNPKRNGPLEQAYTLDGELSQHLEQLRPLSKSAFDAIRIEPPVPTFVHTLLTRPWRAIEGTNVHFGRMVKLANAAVHLVGESSGRKIFDTWIETVRKNSPELAHRSLKNKDSRCVLDHGRDRAWQIALAPRADWMPQPTNGARPRVAELYRALGEYVAAHGLPTTAFAIDYARIADLVGVTKQGAWGIVRAAESAGLLVRHHPGTQDARGVKGQPAVYGLVGVGETPEIVLEAGKRDRLVREREGTA